jgi:hypothetical protein
MKEEMLADMEANQGKMMANMNSQPKKMDACLGKTRGHGFEGKSIRNGVQGGA